MKHITKLFLVGFLATGLVGCFGDSDGDKTPDNPINLPSGSTIGSTATYSNSVTYSGKTNIASFSATDGVNAFYTSFFDDMADDLFEGVDFLFDLEGEYDTYSTRMLSDVRNIRKSSIFQPYIEKSNRYASKSTSQTSNTISSECSNGSLTVSTTDDWSLNYYKMEFVANDFCVNSAVGEIRMNGSSVSEEGEDFYLTAFNNFSLKIGANFDILIGGISISEVIGEDLTRSTVNMVFKNQKSGLQVKFENYV
ncbi:MAG: hypothetical protein IBX55_22125, partial [Methyloprofundus sp.]|nr:hypothetical protein [Methyloprofundus sp.]